MKIKKLTDWLRPWRRRYLDLVDRVKTTENNFARLQSQSEELKTKNYELQLKVNAFEKAADEMQKQRDAAWRHISKLQPGSGHLPPAPDDLI